MDSKRNKGVERLKLYILLGAIIWTCIIVASLMWNIHQAKIQTITKADVMARLSFDKDTSFRTWANFHGGVYVPITEETKPNPYLNVPDRDIETRSGKPLTLMNPAYMMRQYYERFEKKGGVKGHITSLKPLRPENIPDPWEEKSLKTFEQGVKEATTIQTIDNTEYVRLMKPFIVTKGCLKCHSGQGYREGDIRGGISASVPMASLRSLERDRIVTFIGIHTFFWLIGMGGIAIFGKQIIKRERKRNEAEETIRRHKDLLDETGEIAKVGGWEFDVETQEQVWTEEVYRIHEVDMTYKPMVSKGIDFYALASRPIIERSVQRAIEYGEPFDVELGLITAKGNHRWVHVVGKAHQEYGKTKKVSGVFQDITERKQIEATLRESEQKFRTLFEDSRDAIYITTKEGRFIDFNQAYLELFRYTKEEMITLLAKDTYMNLSDRDMFKKTIEKKGSVRDYEAKLRRKDGQQMDCIITATTRYADDGSISGYQGIIKDITERKELEEQLHVVSLTDELTVLYNRRGFFTLAQQQMKVTERTKKDMLLFFADLDKMKQINDTLGHQEGDKALIEVAAILKEVFRESDIIGRMGGDEFAILAIDTTDESREVLINRLHNTLDNYNKHEGRNYQLSLSIGMAHYDPETPSTLDELMAQADTLMYEEKRGK